MLKARDIGAYRDLIVLFTRYGRKDFRLSTHPEEILLAEEFLSGMHKIANRITVGVVIAALLIASSLMMRVPTSLRIAGIPGIAMLGYVAALIAAAYLIVSTFLRDRQDEERAKMKWR